MNARFAASEQSIDKHHLRQAVSDVEILLQGLLNIMISNCLYAHDFDVKHFGLLNVIKCCRN